MIDLYLRTKTKSAMTKALKAAGLTGTDDSGNTTIASPSHTAVDVIGTIYQQTGTATDDEGNEVPTYEAVDGYHVNVRTREQAVADALAAVVIDPPTTPARVFA